ncbi:MAG TPA: tetratricopeptide repeat protein [Candidatus Ozemobacteraceae bacterium]|nr:tetratricopeptide repeat protein [Candidatus Ozemobacteraceae bacterium]
MRNPLPFVFVALLGIAAVSPLNPDRPVVRARELTVEERLFRKAEPLCRAGRIEAAIEDLKRVLKLNPTHAGALYYAGVHRAGKSDTKGAEALFRKILDDAEYGPLARERLAELSVGAKQTDLRHAIRSYLDGEAWNEALETCKKALQHAPNDPALMYLTVYSSVMAGDKRYAEAAWNALGQTSAPETEKGDLRDLIDGWFSRDQAPREALQRLMGITDARIRTTAVRREIRRLMLDQKLYDEYEKMLVAELAMPGANQGAIERDLIRFYVDTGRYDKGMQLLSRRPVDSMEDNLLYIRLLSATGQHAKAMTVAQQLIGMHGDQPEPHEAFLDAYVALTSQKGGLAGQAPADKMKWEKLVKDEIARFRASLDPAETPAAGMTLAVLRASATLNDFELTRALLEPAMRLRIDASNIAVIRKAAEEMAENGCRPESTTLIETALGQLPDDTGLAGLLAENYYLDGRAEEAVALLQGALQAEPRDQRNLVLLVDCLVTVGRRDEARDKLIEAISWPDLPDMVRNQFKAKLNLIDIGAAPIRPGETGTASPPTGEPATPPEDGTATEGTEMPPETASGGAYTGFDGLSAP